MRTLQFLVLAGCAVSSGAVAQTSKVKPHKVERQTLPVFSFMGDTTDAPTIRTDLNGSACTGDGEAYECADYGDPEIAGAKLEWLSLAYHQRLLYRVMASLDSRRFPTVLEAFTIKYGPPSTATKKWQSKGGSTFDNTVATWAFRDGVLTLESMGQSVGKSFFMFKSVKNAPPSAAPRIDF